VPRVDPDRLWICTTHSHDSPDTIGFWGPMVAEVPLGSGLNMKYMEFLFQRAVELINSALDDLRPARLRAASVQAPRQGWTRNVRQESLKDDTIEILQVTGVDRSVIATMYHYACHPEFMGHSHRRLSAGWPGFTNRLLRDRYGGVAFLLQNALGGMVTGAVSRDDGAFDPQQGQPFTPRLGRWVGEAIAGALADAKPVRVDAIRVARRVFDAEVANWRFQLAGRMGVFPRWMLDRKRNTVRTEIALARLGGLALVTLPGEALPEVGFAFKEKLRAHHPWTISLGNDELGYLLSTSAWNDPRYEYERSMSIGPDIVPELERHFDALAQEVG